MKRDVDELRSAQFDVVVIGAGVHGACIARDGAMRGLKVALIDKGDLCGATSHNSLKIIHGGIRYLQHLDFKRTWESIREQKAWLTLAPHLVKPMRCVMPTYGHGLRGREAMWCGIKLFELVSQSQSIVGRLKQRVPTGGVLQRHECLKLIPAVRSDNLTGAATWYDAQVLDADRAVIETVESACRYGASIANYVTANTLLRHKENVIGVRVTDEISGEQFDLRGKLIVNAAGPWAKQFLSQSLLDDNLVSDISLVKSMNVVTKPIFGDYAVALQSKRQSDSVLGATKRLYFFTPWKGCTVIGTTHFPYNGSPDSLTVLRDEVQQFIDEINEVYPKAELTLDDIYYCYAGLTPADAENGGAGPRSATHRARRSRIFDHEASGCRGLLTVVGVKYTAARLIAEKVIDLAQRKLKLPPVRAKTDQKHLPPLFTDTDDVAEFSADQLRTFCEGHIHHTAALHLSDLVFRRMDLAARGRLTAEQLAVCVDAMSETLGWSVERISAEIDSLQQSWLGPQLKNALEKTKYENSKSVQRYS